jgi:hypothetical protein
MTLSVSVYYRDEKENVQMVRDDDAYLLLAGFEKYRKEFYGSEAVKSFGCKYLPTLAARDIFAEGVDLDVLEKEVRILLGNIPALTAALGQPGEDAEEHYRFRLNNIKKAIRLARKHPSGRGGVCIQ